MKIGERRHTLPNATKFSRNVNPPRRSFVPVTYDALRATSQRLGRFTASDVAGHLGISRAQAKKRLEELVLEGIIRTPANPEDRVRREGTGRPAHVYEFVKPEFAPGQNVREKRTPPESQFRVARRARGSITTGRQIKGQSRETDRLVKQARAAGATFKKAKHGTKVLKDGKVVASIPGTPSDSRSTKNTKAELRKAGLAA